VGCISRRDRGFLEGCNFDHPFLRQGFLQFVGPGQECLEFEQEGFQTQSCRSLVFALAMTQF